MRDPISHPRPSAMASAGLLAALLLGPAACVSLPPAPAGITTATSFAAVDFFAGRTEGEGIVAIVAHRRRTFRVQGTGRLEADGTLVLEQRVEESGRPARMRQWRIREVSPGRLAGTLSDAAGPIAGTVTGNMLQLRFRMPGGYAAEQRLYLLADGRTALNRMMVRKLGVVVAVLSETIRKTDASLGS